MAPTLPAQLRSCTRASAQRMELNPGKLKQAVIFTTGQGVAFAQLAP
jgi:hypothetical protein